MDFWRRLEKRGRDALIGFWGQHQGPVFGPEVVVPEQIRRILVVRQHDQLGDFLLATPALRALRERFVQARIALVVRSYTFPVAQGNPDVDQVLVFPDHGRHWTPRWMADFFRHIRGPAFDLAVVLNTVSHSLSSDLIAHFSTAPLVLGPAEPEFEGYPGTPFYNLVAPYDRNEKHQIQRNLDVVRYIGADTHNLHYGFALTPMEQDFGVALAMSLGLQDQYPKMAIHFGAKDRAKKYPLSHLATLTDRLYQLYGRPVVVIRAPDEEPFLADLLVQMHHQPLIAPPLNLREVAAFLRTMDLLICNDSGVLHLASAVRCPTLSFHAKSDPALWKPPGKRHRALYAKNGDIRTITVNQALTETVKLLEGKQSTATPETGP